MTVHRFRFMGYRSPEGQWSLREDEIHHLCKVLRLKTGETVEICDGRGRVATVTLGAISKSLVEWELVDEAASLPSPLTIVMYLAALDHGEVDTLIAPLSELGLDELVIYVPPQTDSRRIGEKQLARWQRLAEAALKQSKRSTLMHVEIAPDLGHYLANCEHTADLLIDASLGPDAKPWHAISRPTTKTRIALHVANESGVDDGDILRRQHGYTAVSLGSNVLRAKTAAISLAALATCDWRCHLSR
jgi:16S rRNA (uracil1498-N3)-methyltransferase